MYRDGPYCAKKSMYLLYFYDTLSMPALPWGLKSQQESISQLLALPTKLKCKEEGKQPDRSIFHCQHQ